jgi:protease I
MKTDATQANGKGPLSGSRFAVLTADEGVEQVELSTPTEALKKAGAEVELISPEGGEVQAFNHLERGEVFKADRSVYDVRVEEFDGLVLPGGVANPDLLRTHQESIGFITDFFREGKTVGAICHAPWTLVEAGVLPGRTLTSWPSLRTDIENAGGVWVDAEVCVDQGFVTSRGPDDLDAFCSKVIEEASERQRAGQLS